MENVKSVNKNIGFRTLDLVYISVGAALIAICSWINIPTAVPFTLQTFGIFTVLLLLGGDRGTMATFIYVLLGAVGVPVFAGFTGGVGILLGTTGGYIIGFLFMGPIYMAAVKLFGNKFYVKAVALSLGLFACYAFGTAWFMHVYTKNTEPVGWITVLTWCVFPFIIPDILKMVCAFLLSKRLKPVIK